jgi:hypothetical protein
MFRRSFPGDAITGSLVSHPAAYQAVPPSGETWIAPDRSRLPSGIPRGGRQHPDHSGARYWRQGPQPNAAILAGKKKGPAVARRPEFGKVHEEQESFSAFTYVVRISLAIVSFPAGERAVVRPGGDIGCPCRAACMNRPRLIQDCFAKLGIWFQLLSLAVDACQNSKKRPGKDRGAPDFPRSEKDHGGSSN